MNRIKQLREEINMTQVRLSIELEVAQETISAYEHGKHYPSITALVKMKKIFNASMDYIMGFSDVRNPIKTLDDNEQIILNMFKGLSKQKKDLAAAYLQGLFDAQNTEKI